MLRLFAPEPWRLLKCLQAYHKEHHCDLQIDTYYGRVMYPGLFIAADALPYKGNDLKIYADYLVDNGYLKPVDGNYRLTQKGLHPMRMTAQQLFRFLLTSVCVPIAVSIVTTLIALHITSAP